MTTIKIEKNVPVPQRTRIPSLPLDQMEVGDSFAAPIKATDPKAVSSLRQRVSRFQRVNPQMRFSVVIDGENMRVFRIA
jgi:hypothetical protein